MCEKGKKGRKQGKGTAENWKGTEKRTPSSPEINFCSMVLTVNDNYNVDITLSDRNLDGLLSLCAPAVLAGRITVLDRATTSLGRLHVQLRAPPDKTVSRIQIRRDLKTPYTMIK